MTTLSKRLTRAMQHHEAGQPEAEWLYCEVLAQQPNQANALYLLGLLAHQVGKLEVAITYYQQALTSSQTVWKPTVELGAALHTLEDCWRQLCPT